jgi:hypothetical protein
VSLAAATVAAGGVAALANGGGGGASSAAAGPTPSSLNRALDARDALSPKLVATLNSGVQRGGASGVDFAQARQVSRGVWLVAGGGNVCMHVGTRTGGAAGCAKAADVAQGGPAITGQFKGSAPSTTGVVPDGVDKVNVEFADGSSQTVPVIGNTYHVSHGAPASGVSFNGPQGHTTSHLPEARIR